MAIDLEARVSILRTAIREVLDMFEKSTHGYSNLCERANDRLRKALRDEFATLRPIDDELS